MRQTKIYLDEAAKALLKHLAEQQHCSMSTLLYQALQYYAKALPAPEPSVDPPHERQVSAG